MRRRRKLARGNEDKRVKTTIENEREEEEEKKWCLLQTQEEEPGGRGKPATQGPTDTMLRLNIRCLNNQARFDPRRLPRGDEREKDRERKNEGEREKTSVQMCARGRGTQRNESCVENEKEREEEAEKEIPVPTEWESNTFSAVLRFRSAPDPPFYLPPSRTFSSAPSSYTSSDLTKVSSVRLPSRRPYAKCIYVLCKASNRRWPREPDAQCVINTDALVVPFPPSSPPVPFAYSSSQSVPCLCRSSRASETHRSSR